MAPRVRRVRRARKGRKNVRRGRRTGNVKDLASCSVKATLVSGAPGGGFLPNTLYNQMATQLSDFPRAITVAQAY